MGKPLFRLARLFVPVWSIVACSASTPSPQSPSSQEPPVPAPDESSGALSKRSSPRLTGKANWDCPFPQAADGAEIDQAVVSIVVAVKTTGEADWVQILADPGYNFGLVAATCAMHMRFAPARNAEGVPIWAVTPPIQVRFTR